MFFKAETCNLVPVQYPCDEFSTLQGDKMSFNNKAFSRLKNNDEVGHGLAGKNKSLAIKTFDKMLKKERRKQKFATTDKTLNNFHKHNERLGNKGECYGNNSKFSKFKEESIKQRKQAEKLQAEELRRQKEKEKALALVKRKEDRLKKFKVLNKRTKKGQPIMGHRMNMLLEQIQKQI